jgi:glycerophosphoryl diester phosphodiesterase
VQQRLPSLLDEPIAFAHRGARAHAPENTIEAFQLGLKLGANGLESDVWVTADGEVVLDHDGVVRLRARKRPISEVQRSSLPSHIPTVGEFFDSCGTNFQFSVDIKDENATDGLVSVARECGFDLSRLYVCHWKSAECFAIRERHPDIKVVDSTRLQRLKDGPEMRAALLANKGIDVLNMHISDWNGGLVTLLHRFNVQAFGWDAQFPTALNNGLLMGLDGIYSDHVDRMVESYDLVIGHVPRL